MKRLLTAVACVVGLALTATNAQALALTIGDAYYLGSINDGIPSSLAHEAGYINNLKTLAAGQGNTVIGTETYNRVGSTLAGPFPLAVAGTAIKFNTSVGTGISISGWTYILAKYDAAAAGSLVWKVDTLSGTVDIPSTFNGKGLSHYSLFNPFDVPDLPDGGATIGLLGLSLLGLNYLRRRL